MALINGLNSALSGVLAGQNRFNVTASNVANVESVGRASYGSGDGYAALRATDQTTATGGVVGRQALADPSVVQRFDPGAADANADGIVNRPNVDLSREATERISAQAQFEANLATIRTADELAESTLDIIS